jgi:hypothetical protein
MFKETPGGAMCFTLFVPQGVGPRPAFNLHGRRELERA